MKLAILPVVVVMSASLPAAAQDSTTPALSTIVADLETSGYRITGLDVDIASIEIDAVTQDNRRVELRIDPATGKTVSETADD